MNRLGEIFLWLWLAGTGIAYSLQFEKYAIPVARLVRDLVF